MPPKRQPKRQPPAEEHLDDEEDFTTFIAPKTGSRGSDLISCANQLALGEGGDSVVGGRKRGSGNTSYTYTNTTWATNNTERESVEDDMPRLEDGPRVRRGSVTASPPCERVARREITPLPPDAREGAREEGMLPATYLGRAMDNMATLMREMKEMQADNRRLRETLIVPREPVTRTVTEDELGTLSTRDSIKELPSYLEGGDLATFIRGLEAELKELGVEDKHWRSILLLKLPPKIKEQVVEHIEGRKPYPELKCALLTKVGKSLQELEHEFFPPRRRCTKDRVQRVREITTMANRVFMLCPTEEALKLFVVRGMLYSELPPHECGILSGQGAETVNDLVDATSLLRENNLACGRDNFNRST